MRTMRRHRTCAEHAHVCRRPHIGLFAHVVYARRRLNVLEHMAGHAPAHSTVIPCRTQQTAPSATLARCPAHKPLSSRVRASRRPGCRSSNGSSSSNSTLGSRQDTTAATTTESTVDRQPQQNRLSSGLHRARHSSNTRSTSDNSSNTRSTLATTQNRLSAGVHRAHDRGAGKSWRDRDWLPPRLSPCAMHGSPVGGCS